MKNHLVKVLPLNRYLFIYKHPYTSNVTMLSMYHDLHLLMLKKDNNSQSTWKSWLRKTVRPPFIANIIAELLACAKRACGRSPIAKVIYPSQKIW